MSTEVVLHLPENLYRQAGRMAELSNRDLPHVLTETLEKAFFPLGPVAETLPPIEKLSDEEVLKLANLQMESSQGKRLSRLLAQQNAGQLNKAEELELIALFQVNQEGMLRKAQALAEAVRRGLREPLSP
jgi:hypothetical protein